MAWNRSEGSLPGGRAAVRRMETADARREKERARLFAERNWRPLYEWDLEELLMGCPRRDDGSWPRGPRPQWIEPWLAEELMRRFNEEAAKKLMSLLPGALAVLGSVLDQPATGDPGTAAYYTANQIPWPTDPRTGENVTLPIGVDPRLKVDVAKWVGEQILGKAKQKVDVVVEERATTFLAERVVLDDGRDAHPVIAGNLADDEEPDGGE